MAFPLIQIEPGSVKMGGESAMCPFALIATGLPSVIVSGAVLRLVHKSPLAAQKHGSGNVPITSPLSLKSTAANAEVASLGVGSAANPVPGDHMPGLPC